MLDIDRVWNRVAQLPQYREKKLSDFVLQDLTYSTQLQPTQTVPNQNVVFPAGAIIVGVGGAATLDASAATVVTRNGLDLFKLAISDQQTGRTIAGTAQVAGIALFGQYNDRFPAKELIIPAQGGLIYSLTNLTSSIINLFLTHSCLVPAVVG
jgi:hypothetical protein